MRRRAWLVGAAAALRAAGAGGAARRSDVITLPRDHGAHLAVRTEWWYATGWLGRPEQPQFGIQLTFFRRRSDIAFDPGSSDSRFAARQILFAHAAVTDVANRRHRHAQRIARWSGNPAAALAHAASADTDVVIHDWSLRRDAAGYRARLPAGDFALDLQLRPTQPPLLQGAGGISRKGPDEQHASHYYSEPQLALQGRVDIDGRRIDAAGRAWLDREWSDAYTAPGVVGWDWIGFNLFDGGALMAFQMRRADGSALWAGGSLRRAGAAVAAFGVADVHFSADRRWTSPATQARYPVEWHLDTPAGSYAVRALVDAQELDSRASSGAIYWEGLAELVDRAGRRVGLGYLEMTGYAAAIRL